VLAALLPLLCLDCSRQEEAVQVPLPGPLLGRLQALVLVLQQERPGAIQSAREAER